MANAFRTTQWINFIHFIAHANSSIGAFWLAHVAVDATIQNMKCHALFFAHVLVIHGSSRFAKRISGINAFI